MSSVFSSRNERMPCLMRSLSPTRMSSNDCITFLFPRLPLTFARQTSLPSRFPDYRLLLYLPIRLCFQFPFLCFCEQARQRMTLPKAYRHGQLLHCLADGQVTWPYVKDHGQISRNSTCNKPKSPSSPSHNHTGWP